MSRVAVVGSLNCDLVVRAARRPQIGETLTGSGFQIFVGGKGNNQAIAAARAGASVSMIGRVGNDGFAALILERLVAAGVDCANVSRDPDLSTGIADILVDDAGANSIVVVPQANGRFTSEHVDSAMGAIRAARVALLQLEIPLTTVSHAARRAKASGALVVLNPAPAQPSLPRELVESVDLLVPNQIEAEQISGVVASDVTSGKEAAAALVRAGYRQVVLTMAGDGAIFADGTTPPTHVPAHAVRVVDSTAAGDAFCGAMVAALAAGSPLGEAVRVGNAAGALACMRLGAEPSLPLRADIDRLLRG